MATLLWIHLVWLQINASKRWEIWMLSDVLHTHICSTVNRNVSTEVCLLLSRGLWDLLHFKSLLTLCASTRATLSHSVLFCFPLMAEEKVKEEERKCLHQRPASISPSVRGEDWSLPWLISRLIWQDMFDLIKASGRKPVPDVKAGKKTKKPATLSPLTRNSIT